MTTVILAIQLRSYAITLAWIIGRYYSLDAEVARELVGRGQKMTAKLRKDFDTISEKTRIPLKSCLRQFDNIKRIYKVF